MGTIGLITKVLTRGREQQPIDGFRARGLSANKINGIGPRSVLGLEYRQQALDAFEPSP